MGHITTILPHITTILPHITIPQTATSSCPGTPPLRLPLLLPLPLLPSILHGLPGLPRQPLRPRLPAWSQPQPLQPIQQGKLSAIHSPVGPETHTSCDWILMFDKRNFYMDMTKIAY